MITVCSLNSLFNSLFLLPITVMCHGAIYTLYMQWYWIDQKSLYIGSCHKSPIIFFFFYCTHCQCYDVIKLINYYFLKQLIRSKCWSHCSITNNPNGNKPFCVWDMQQRVPKGPKPSVAQKRPQSSMEASTKNDHRG